MKLSHYIIRNLLAPLFLIILVWASVFYMLIMHEVYDETDDTLENYKELIIRKALTDPDFDYTYSNEMTRYKIREVDPSTAKLSEDTFYDSTTYIETEMEDEPVRVLRSYYMDAEGRCFELEIELSTLEKEDMAETIFWSIVVLYFILLCCVLLVTHYVFRKSFTPLYGLLNWLKRIHPGKKEETYEMDTKVDEFITLNKALVESVHRNREIYNQQKQFVENAAHELQTPLAIATNKLELFSENPDCTEAQLKEIGDIYNALRGVIKMNKSLLLLSRIENKQYPETTEVNINEILHHLLESFVAVYENKSLQIHVDEKDILLCRMNEPLARVLISNLLKNAFVHNYAGGTIRIHISRNRFTISNTGKKTGLNEANLYSRFNKEGTSSDSTGLGLAIVKSISLLYEMEITYDFKDEMHSFYLLFKI